MDSLEHYPFRYTDPEHPPKAQPRRRPQDSDQSPTADIPHNPSGAQPVDPSVPSPSAETVVLEGMIAAQNLAGYGFTLGMGQLLVAALDNPNKGGVYDIGRMPVGRWWFQLYGKDKSSLPVAVRKARYDALWVTVDPGRPFEWPIHGWPSMPGY